MLADYKKRFSAESWDSQDYQLYKEYAEAKINQLINKLFKNAQELVSFIKRVNLSSCARFNATEEPLWNP